MYRGIIGAALTVTDTTTETLRVTAVRSEMNIALAWVRRIAVTLRGGTAITTTTVSVTVSTPRRSPSRIALAFIATKACGNDLAIEPLGDGSCLCGLGAVRRSPPGLRAILYYSASPATRQPRRHFNSSIARGVGTHSSQPRFSSDRQRGLCLGPNAAVQQFFRCLVSPAATPVFQRND